MMPVMTKPSYSSITILALDCKREMSQLAQAIQAGPALHPFTFLLGNEIKHFPHRAPYLSVIKMPNGNVLVQIVHPSEMTIHKEEESFCIPSFTGWREPRVCNGTIIRSWNKEFEGPIVLSELASILVEALNDLVMTYARVANDEAQKLHVTPRDSSLLRSLGQSALLRSRKVVQISEDISDLLVPNDLATACGFEGAVIPDPLHGSLTSGPVLRCTTTHRGLPASLLACFRDLHGHLNEISAWNGNEFSPIDSGQMDATLLTPVSEEFAVHLWGSGVRAYQYLSKKGDSNVSNTDY